MGRYEFVQEDVLNGYILEHGRTKDEDSIICLCNTKRPDLGFYKVKHMIELANTNAANL